MVIFNLKEKNLRSRPMIQATFAFRMQKQLMFPPPMVDTIPCMFLLMMEQAGSCASEWLAERMSSFKRL